MSSVKEATGVVENGQVRLPDAIRLPDGMQVRVLWDEKDEREHRPYEREMLTEDDLEADLRWATGQRFSS